MDSGSYLCSGPLHKLYLVLSVQRDLGLREESGLNTDEQATSMFIELLKETRRQIDIHDDGNDFDGSMYNDPEVMDALRDCIQERNITVRCLFNDANQELSLLELARTKEYGGSIEIWYLNGGRQEPDTHYKIVDNGRARGATVGCPRHLRGGRCRQRHKHAVSRGCPRDDRA